MCDYDEFSSLLQRADSILQTCGSDEASAPGPHLTQREMLTL
jgi:hypothetical protein